jgi:hypothetical protein
MKGSEVTILAGHGFAGGTMMADLALFGCDVAMLGAIEGVTVMNVAEMPPSAISTVVIGAGNVIGGFCDSGACPAQLIR